MTMLRRRSVLNRIRSLLGRWIKRRVLNTVAVCC